jgi:hypothetical protein
MYVCVCVCVCVFMNVRWLNLLMGKQATTHTPQEIGKVKQNVEVEAVKPCPDGWVFLFFYKKIGKQEMMIL